MVGFLPGCDEFVPHTMAVGCSRARRVSTPSPKEDPAGAPNRSLLARQVPGISLESARPLEEWFINVHNKNWAIYIHLHQEKG